MNLEEVLFIYEEVGEKAARALAAAAGLQLLPLRQVTAGALSGRQAIVVDIDLRNLESVVLLKRALPDAGKRPPLLVAIETGAQLHASQLQANALGAKRLLRRPLHPAHILRALADFGVELPVRKPVGILAEPGGASVQAASKALQGAFKGVTTGEALDVSETITASRALLAGIENAGLAAWLDTVRGHHDGTFQHCLLVTGAAAALGQQLGLPDKDQYGFAVAALLHDIGKAEIPLEILDKPGRLSEAEFAVIKTHPGIAERYLREQQGIPPAIVAAIAQHHEYLDGSGYPDGLAGDQIGPLARMLTVCDVYGALIEKRAYKPPKSPYESILILADMARAGKVEYGLVRSLGLAVGVTLPEGQFHIA